MTGRGQHGIVANVLDCDIVTSEFELEQRYYVDFRTYTLGKGMKPFLTTPSYELNNTTVLLQREKEKKKKKETKRKETKRNCRPTAACYRRFELPLQLMWIVIGRKNPGSTVNLTTDFYD